jgi:putative tryptophan/tyrosine transport system substrate-binding protein
MIRREFIALLGGAAAAWPLAAGAQQGEPMRRIGVLTGASGPVSDARLYAFLKALAQLGWTEAQNVRLEIRRGGGDAEAIGKHAVELAALAPDVIMAIGGTATGRLLQATRSVPIVFAHVPDPVGTGLVNSLARPGGNVTGFTSFEYGMAGKWLELLKQIAPGVKRAAVIRDPAITAGIGQWGAINAVAPSVGLEVIPMNVRDADDIEHAVAAFARGANDGLIVTGSGLAVLHRDLIVMLAARHKLPTVYYDRYFVAAGGLISYGPGYLEIYRQAAGYVDRILKGEKPADLPVQAPDQVRAGDQPQDCEGARPRSPFLASCPRRRGD